MSKFPTATKIYSEITINKILPQKIDIFKKLKIFHFLKIVLIKGIFSTFLQHKDSSIQYRIRGSRHKNNKFTFDYIEYLDVWLILNL